jgi:hypothetical protein
VRHKELVMTLETRPRRTETAVRPRTGPAVHLLCVALLVLTAAATLTGLLREATYTGPPATRAMLRAYDLVTLVVVVPTLAVATVRARRGGTLARTVRTSMLAFLVYNYAYYVFGTGFADLFLLHVVLFATALVTLVLDVSGTDLEALRVGFGEHPRTRPAAIVLGTLALALGTMWVWVSLDNAVSGDVPAGSSLVETPAMVHLGIALDLAVLVPWYAAAAVLLWRQAPWGFLLAATALVSGLLHQVSYAVALPFQVAADIPGAVSLDPVEPVIVLLYLGALATLLRSAVRPR